MLFATGISYTIWDKQTGIKHLIEESFFMTAVQLVYWAVNLFVLYFLTKKPEKSTDILDPTE